MALTQCKECKKDVSTSAKTCPHCGVSNPAVTAGAMLKGVVLTVLLIGGCVGILSVGDDGKSKDQPPKLSDAECMQDLQCWGDRKSIEATFKCQPAIERMAKYSFEWTDAMLEPKMSRFRWKDQAAGVVTFIGDKVKFQNGFGAWQAMIYECDYSPAAQLVLDVRLKAGKI